MPWKLHNLRNSFSVYHVGWWHRHILKLDDIQHCESKVAHRAFQPS